MSLRTNRGSDLVQYVESVRWKHLREPMARVLCVRGFPDGTHLNHVDSRAVNHRPVAHGAEHRFELYELSPRRLGRHMLWDRARVRNNSYAGKDH
jgi:hypothetical protein